MLLSTLKFCKGQLELETVIKNQSVTRPELYPLLHEIQSKIKLIDILNATNKKILPNYISNTYFSFYVQNEYTLKCVSFILF